MTTSADPVIRPALAGDEIAIADIYNWYIANTVITFEEEPLGSQDMAARIFTDDDTCPWIVIELDGEVSGYAYAARWKPRSAYRNSRETSVYLRRDATGKGLGRRLYQHLINELRQTPIHLLIAGIALPNAASVALHESLGFSAVGQFGEVGRKFDKWVDVGYWQMQL